ncbi:MAG: hypothetical protein V7676_17900 [Parasphingorhabdus sp.]|uniref:hypothetical protein n=1 Tax=Parasphingorhabdus sp. TaxID=2709688 RepID=UPI0030037697
MRKMASALGALVLLYGGSALAHEHKADASSDQKCRMMKDGKAMDGMMMKDADGKMTCQMMDHSKMDHSKMDHSKMDTSKAKPE